jgi:hypothetical protein
LDLRSSGHRISEDGNIKLISFTLLISIFISGYEYQVYSVKVLPVSKAHGKIILRNPICHILATASEKLKCPVFFKIK